MICTTWDTTPWLPVLLFSVGGLKNPRYSTVESCCRSLCCFMQRKRQERGERWLFFLVFLMLGHDLITVGKGCVWRSRSDYGKEEKWDRLTVFFYSRSCWRSIEKRKKKREKKKTCEWKGKAVRGEKWLNYFWVVRLVARIGLKSSGKERKPGPFADDCLWFRRLNQYTHIFKRTWRHLMGYVAIR